MQHSRRTTRYHAVRESNLRSTAPSTRRVPCTCVCSMAWRALVIARRGPPVDSTQGSNFVKVMPRGLSGATDANLLERGAFLEPEKLNGSNGLELFVFDNDARGTACLVARLDNLGKGASGAAVQNLNIMLGLGEDLGLQL